MRKAEAHVLCRRFLSAFVLALGLLSVLWSLPASAGFTETLPQGTFLLDEAYVHSWVSKRWNNSGDSAPLIDELERYEPGGGKQGVLTPKPKAQFILLISQLQYGILDNLSLGLGVPVVLYSKVDPNLKWESGDYMQQLGRPYSGDDFWAWAESMGQTKPKTWTGNRGQISDLVPGVRLRWTDWIEAFKTAEVAGALSVMGAIPTGKHPDPEEIVSTGTTMWDLQTMGDLAVHVSFDKTFKEQLDGRLRLGLDLFYETFFSRAYTTSTGEKHPLLLNYEPYVGKHYDVNPGDFSGFSFQTDVVPYYGPAWGTWITKGDASKAKNFPPIISFYLRYTFIHLQQSQWSSNNAAWDYKQEKLWKPGYRNQLAGQVTFSFLRLGAPLQLYVGGRTLSLIPGKNTRAADVVTAGIQLLMKFW